MIVTISCELEYEFDTILGKNKQPLIKANRQVKIDLVEWIEGELKESKTVPYYLYDKETDSYVEHLGVLKNIDIAYSNP